MTHGGEDEDQAGAVARQFHGVVSYPDRTVAA